MKPVKDDNLILLMVYGICLTLLTAWFIFISSLTEPTTNIIIINNTLNTTETYTINENNEYNDTDIKTDIENIQKELLGIENYDDNALDTRLTSLENKVNLINKRLDEFDGKILHLEDGLFLPPSHFIL